MTIQEFDTECATMTFGEEDIDWKVMNIKMTIDKTGNQHPSWIYTPLYTKDILTPNLDSPDEDQYVIQPHPVDQVIVVVPFHRLMRVNGHNGSAIVLHNLFSNHFISMQRVLEYILPQSSGNFDPEADPELKKPPDPSEISIWRNFRKLSISIRTRIRIRNNITK